MIINFILVSTILAKAREVKFHLYYSKMDLILFTTCGQFYILLS